MLKIQKDYKHTKLDVSFFFVTIKKNTRKSVYIEN